MKRFLAAPVAALALVAAFSSTVMAHSLYISAWVEGDQVCTESSFSTKSRPKGSTVTVVDATGTVVQEGVTNDRGEVCFPLPKQPGELKYVVNAGQGHRAETTLYEEDFPETATAPATPAAVADPEAVRAVVRAELQSQLGPIRQTLTAMQTRKPGFTEIFGGLGWIAGLAGVAMMASARRKK